MKKHPLLIAWIFALVVLSSATMAQQPGESVKESFAYKLVLPDGTNASAVAWDAQNQVYVTVVAGNREFPMEVFDVQGQAIAQAEAGFDLRGLWFNPATRHFEGNGAGEYGWIQFVLDADHAQSEVMLINDGQLQPDFNSVGAYDASKKQVVFLDFSCNGLSMYARKNPKKIKHLKLNFSDSNLGNMNSTTVGVTGHEGYDYVLLDVEYRRLVFFNREGKQTALTTLPDSAPIYDSFAFSFANGHAFLYDKEYRTWHAYPVW